MLTYWVDNFSCVFLLYFADVHSKIAEIFIAVYNVDANKLKMPLPIR